MNSNYNVYEKPTIVLADTYPVKCCQCAFGQYEFYNQYLCIKWCTVKTAGQSCPMAIKEDWK